MGEKVSLLHKILWLVVRINPTMISFCQRVKAQIFYLITEAQSHTQSRLCLDIYPSLDDLLPGDFNRTVGSLLSAKAEGILSWIGDDNFLMEDKKGANHEASSDCEAVRGLSEELTSEELTFGSISDKVKITDQTTEVTSSATSNDLPDPFLSILESISVDQVVIDTRQVDNEADHLRNFSNSIAQSSVNSFPDPDSQLSRFEAATAEAELDMLLDSFSETKILDSSGSRSADTFPVQEAAKVSLFEIPRKDPNSLPSTTGNLDDALDDLLEETSSLLNKSSLTQPEADVAVRFVEPSSSSGSKSKVLDDFDSWLNII